MSIDLFDNKLEQKGLTATQRMTIRQAEKTSRDLYTTDPKDIERFLAAVRKSSRIIKNPPYRGAWHGKPVIEWIE